MPLKRGLRVWGSDMQNTKQSAPKRIRVRFINSGYLKALERFATANRSISLFLAIPDGKPLHTFPGIALGRHPFGLNGSGDQAEHNCPGEHERKGKDEIGEGACIGGAESLGIGQPLTAAVRLGVLDIGHIDLRLGH
jgi:hypothetical protein